MKVLTKFRFAVFGWREVAWHIQNAHRTVTIVCMFLVLCSSSLKALLLSHNNEKEDFSESTIEDIKGWSKVFGLQQIN
jgi:hypothetical protein